MNSMTRLPKTYLFLFLYIPSVLADDTKSNIFSTEASCYSLPYGGWGFFSHAITYYTVIVLCCNRRPGMPWAEREEDSTWNKVLAVAHLLMTLPPAIKTMVSCSHAWQFESIAAMKLALSLSSGFIAIFPSPWWLLLYLPGVIAGTAGTISLASSNFTNTMLTVTAVFGGVSLACCIASIIISCYLLGSEKGDNLNSGVLALFSFYTVSIPVCVVFGALYSDWVLAIAADNLTGYPTDESDLVQALWVLYMIGKRLSLLTI
ncbi:uncharacterized protein Bfra_010305 [Botrytis fragariae]|uniref:Uncharacterized protein n=1 Tax=Botrytis fragariae TaxID=1964551 RepID=A0A8H6AMJ7_9HELO|nr:uncharacterized protein Bfra_010305 [Botrytis fragariae]KAF5870159.1 hypothetical protein Bfra_010305 [Botrytis fragariae]